VKVYRSSLLFLSIAVLLPVGSVTSPGFGRIGAALAQEPSADSSATPDTLRAFAGDSVMVVVDRFRVIGDPARIEAIPGSAHLLDRVDLERQHLLFDDAHRLLRQVPGINIQEEEGFGLRVNIGMRGTGSERSSKITVMEDGVLIAPAPYAAPAAYYFPLVGRMEAIEVRKGSSQIKYGPQTTGGALNLISSSIPDQLTLRATLEGGEHDTGKLYARAGDAYANFGWLLETYQSQTDGFKKLDGGGDTGFELQDYLLKLRANTDEDASIQQQLELKLGRTSEVSDETYLGLTESDFRIAPFRRYQASQLDDFDADHEQVQLRHVLRPSGRFDVTTVAYRNDFHRNWYKLQDVGGKDLAEILGEPDAFAGELAVIRGANSEPGALRVRANNRDYYGRGVQSVMGVLLGAGAVEHELEVGLRYHEDQEDRFQHDDRYQMLDGEMILTAEGAPGSQANRVSDARAWAFFLQDQVSLGRWILTPGMRYETIDFTRTDFAADDPERKGTPAVLENGVDVLIPGAGASFAATSELSFFGGVHRGFGPPGPGADQETKAEESVNYELGSRYERGVLNAQVAGFYNDYENILGRATLATGESGSGDLFNGGAVKVIGLEVSAEADLGETLRVPVALPLRFAYTLTSAEFRSSFESQFEPWGTVEEGDELPYVPEHQLFAGLGLERGRWGVDLNASYVSRMRTTAGQGPIPDGDGTDDAVIFGASGELAVTPWSKVFVAVQNLTDQEYVVARRPAGARPGLPRTLAAGIQLSH
jgi:Fe(3+) dicitrate transport protein